MQEIIFYDGHCAACSRWVTFVVRHDRHRAFHFAPLDGETFALRFSALEKEQLPDSVIVLRQDGTALVRSTAVLYVLWRLGGFWKLTAQLAMIVPRPLRDGLYRLVAGLRPRQRGEKGCPTPEGDLGERLLP